MGNTFLPIRTPLSNERIYAGFWQRLGAFWVDGFLFVPFTIAQQFITNAGRLNYFYMLIPSYALFIFLHVYCVKRWGGSPGKLICGIIVTRTDGAKAGWKEAWLRQSVSILIGIPFIVAMFVTLTGMSDEEYMSLTSMRMVQVMQQLPPWNEYFQWTNQIWIWSEFVVLLLNKRKRALHDFVAGTIVIKKKYRDQATAYSEGKPFESVD